MITNIAIASEHRALCLRVDHIQDVVFGSGIFSEAYRSSAHITKAKIMSNNLPYVQTHVIAELTARNVCEGLPKHAKEHDHVIITTEGGITIRTSKSLLSAYLGWSITSRRPHSVHAPLPRTSISDVCITRRATIYRTELLIMATPSGVISHLY